MTTLTSNTLLIWLKGGDEHKPVFIILAAIIFLAIYFMPTPKGMEEIVTKKNPIGFKTKPGYTIIDHLNDICHTQPDGAGAYKKIDVQEACRRIKVVTGMILVAAILWGTVGMPVGATAFLVAVIMYVTNLWPTSMIAKFYMKDAVFFIIGALALAVGVEKTGLDRRIGLVFLGWTKSRISLLFVFGPAMAIVAMFISAKCLIAFLMPVLMRLYKNICRANGLERNPKLGLFLIFTILYMTAMGGPGAPTVGARNVIMMNIFAEMGKPMTFIQWMKYGFLFVPIGSFAVGIYLYMFFNKKVMDIKIDPGKHIKEDVKALGKYQGKEVIMTVILLTVIGMWVFMGQSFGLGGPAILGVVLMFLTGIISWDELNNNVSWGVVWMYAAAVGLGKVILETGTGIWLATTAFHSLPDFMVYKEGLLMSISVLTTVVTNFMNDGAAVAVIGPITIPMHAMAGLDIWKVGLATAFSSSFAHCILIGRPGLVIAYTLGRDPETGERLLDLGQLFKYGFGLVIISWFILWGWTFFGYWKFLSF
jgi:sodium-dependent dicarboxylate transporter 2/3/5